MVKSIPTSGKTSSSSVIFSITRILICEAIMANPGALCCSITLQAFTILSVLAALVADVKGGNGCPPFSCGHLKNLSDPFRSCGHLKNLSDPFRRRGDPPGCGSDYYELECSDSQATIRIGDAAYYVVSINYTDKLFWAVDTIFDTNSSCPLPASYSYPWGKVDSHGLRNLEVQYTGEGGPSACLVNCSQAITNNSWYKPVACLSANSSFVYVWAGSCDIFYLEHSCGYLAMTPFDASSIPDKQLHNVSYADIMPLTRKGFPISFPRPRFDLLSIIIKECLDNSTR
jgi:hypothetical protein